MQSGFYTSKRWFLGNFNTVQAVKRRDFKKGTKLKWCWNMFVLHFLYYIDSMAHVVIESAVGDLHLLTAWRFFRQRAETRRFSQKKEPREGEARTWLGGSHAFCCFLVMVGFCWFWLLSTSFDETKLDFTGEDLETCLMKAFGFLDLFQIEYFLSLFDKDRQALIAGSSWGAPLHLRCAWVLVERSTKKRSVGGFPMLYRPNMAIKSPNIRFVANTFTIRFSKHHLTFI